MDLSKEKPVSTSPLPLPKKLLANNNLPSPKLMAFGVSLLLVSAVSLLFGQRIGYNRGLSYAAEESRKVAEGQEISARNVKALKQKSDLLQGQLITAQQERDISLSNLTDLRESTKDLNVANLQLAQGQEFLTKALAKKGGLPLQVIGAKIAPLPENAYEYRFDVGMIDPTGESKSLSPKLTLIDDVNMVEVPLEPSSYTINGIARIRGRFIMPKDFAPKQMKLELSVGNQKAEHIYDWQLGQPINDLPYSLEEAPDEDKRPIVDGEVSSTPITTAPVTKDEPKTDKKPEHSNQEPSKDKPKAQKHDKAADKSNKSDKNA